MLPGACILLLLAASTQAGPKDVTQKRQLSAGEILKLRCVTDVVNREVQWIIPETTVNSSKWELSTKPLDRNDGTYYRSTLRVFNVNSFDTGFYTCAIQESRDSSKNRSQPSRKRGRVVSGSKVDKAVKRNYVYVYDGSTLLMDVPLSITVDEGDDFILPCRPTHRGATVDFKSYASKDRTEKHLSLIKSSFNSMHGFLIQNATAFDEGLWICKAQFKNVKQSRRIQVSVNAVRELKMELRDVTVYTNNPRVLSNQSVELVCEVKVTVGGKIKFDWKTPPNSTTVIPVYHVVEDKKDAKTDKWQSILRIPQTSQADTGKYICKTTLGDQEKIADIDIEVVDSPYIRVLQRPGDLPVNSTMVAVEGYNVALNFAIDALPEPKFNWFNGSQPIQNTFRQLQEDEYDVNAYKTDLTISNISPHDAGVYTLVIKTKLRTKVETITIKVVEPQPADIVNTSAAYNEVVLGEDHVLYCNITGQPKPTIEWFRGATKLLEGETTLRIERMKPEDEGNYTCVAKNPTGLETRSHFVRVRDPNVAKTTGFSVLSAVLLLATFCTIWMLISKIKKVNKLKRQMNNEQQYLVPVIDSKEMSVEEQAHCLNYDPKKWEFPRDRLKFGKTLGRGAFGRVVQATAFDIERSSSCKTVAVKMLKVGSRSSEYRALMSELKILIHLGPHLNIVNLLGACTTKDGPLMIIVEYCRHGNLSSYLRRMRSCYVGGRRNAVEKKDAETKKHRLLSDDSADDTAFSSAETDRGSWIIDKRVSRTSCTSTSDTIASHDCENGGKTRLSSGCEDSNMNLRKSSETNDDDQKVDGSNEKSSLTLTDLLSYCLQVARGMEFLASKKCIHRDLAARNVLLSDYQVVKICDFGLARDVYKDPDYVRSGDARLPIKWMAPESIFDKVYSTKSDVWSFGVLLWEVFSLGGSPYPGLQTDEDFCNKLRRGVRMSKPPYATSAAYSNMLACWATAPVERPTFTKLCEELSDVLQDEAGHEYLDILKIFQNSVEGETPLRGVGPQKTPEETFEIKDADPSSSDDAVNYTDVQVEIFKDRKVLQSARKSEETVQTRADIHLQILNEVGPTSSQLISADDCLSEDSGLCASTDKNLLHVDAGSFRSLDSCSGASSCDAPPLYDDVIAQRESFH